MSGINEEGFIHFTTAVFMEAICAVMNSDSEYSALSSNESDGGHVVDDLSDERVKEIYEGMLKDSEFKAFMARVNAQPTVPEALDTLMESVGDPEEGDVIVLQNKLLSNKPFAIMLRRIQLSERSAVRRSTRGIYGYRSSFVDLTDIRDHIANADKDYSETLIREVRGMRINDNQVWDDYIQALAEHYNDWFSEPTDGHVCIEQLNEDNFYVTKDSDNI